jgi:hypothetical protein
MNRIGETLLLMVCVTWIASVNVFGQTQGHIDREIAKAKANGRSEIHEEAPLITYNNHDTLQELTADRHPFLVTVVAVTAPPDSDRDTLCSLTIC